MSYTICLQFKGEHSRNGYSAQQLLNIPRRNPGCQYLRAMRTKHQLNESKPAAHSGTKNSQDVYHRRSAIVHLA